VSLLDSCYQTISRISISILSDIIQKTIESIHLFTSYMVSFCNRYTVFLPISGHRYRTEFRLKISTGSPTEEGVYWAQSQGKIAEAKARPPSSKPRGHPAPIFADGICWRRGVARVSVPRGCAGECAAGLRRRVATCQSSIA
jgi:hypothetical protein